MLGASNLLDGRVGSGGGLNEDQEVATDARQLLSADPWYRSGGGRRASALVVSAVGRRRTARPLGVLMRALATFSICAGVIVFSLAACAARPIGQTRIEPPQYFLVPPASADLEWTYHESVLFFRGPGNEHSLKLEFKPLESGLPITRDALRPRHMVYAEPVEEGFSECGRSLVHYVIRPVKSYAPSHILRDNPRVAGTAMSPGVRVRFSYYLPENEEPVLAKLLETLHSISRGPTARRLTRGCT